MCLLGCCSDVSSLKPLGNQGDALTSAGHVLHFPKAFLILHERQHGGEVEAAIFELGLYANFQTTRSYIR